MATQLQSAQTRIRQLEHQNESLQRLTATLHESLGKVNLEVAALLHANESMRGVIGVLQEKADSLTKDDGALSQGEFARWAGELYCRVYFGGGNGKAEQEDGGRGDAKAVEQTLNELSALALSL